VIAVKVSPSGWDCLGPKFGRDLSGANCCRPPVSHPAWSWATLTDRLGWEKAPPSSQFHQVPVRLCGVQKGCLQVASSAAWPVHFLIISRDIVELQPVLSSGSKAGRQARASGVRPKTC